MADIFREVDEEVRQDRLQLVLSRYWGLILVAVLLILAGVGGWRGYEYWRQQRAEESGGRYLDALRLARDGKGADAIKALDDLAATGTPGYRVLARMRSASQIGLANAADGAKAFDALAADASLDPALQDVARLRAAALLVDTLDLPAMKGRLESLADANSALRNPARALLVLSALKAGDDAAATPWLDATVTDPAATAGERQWAQAMQNLVRADETAKH